MMELNGNHWQLRAEPFPHHKGMDRVPRGEVSLAGLGITLLTFTWKVDLVGLLHHSSINTFSHLPQCVKLRGPEI